MSAPNLTVELSSDGTYLNIKDVAPISEYVDMGIDITTDIVTATFILTDSDDVDYTYGVTSVFLTEMRESSGTDIDATILGTGVTFIPDGRYTATLNIVENSTGSDVTLTSTNDYIFISQIVQVVITQIKEADWKNLYFPYSNRISTELRKRFYILDIQYSAQSGLLTEAEEARLALNKLCGYDG